MGRRKWLDDLLDQDYLPTIAALPDSEAGREQLVTMAQQLRDDWARRGFSALSQQQPLMDMTRRTFKDELGESHFALDYFRFSTQEYTEINDRKLQNTADRNEDVKQISDPEAIVAKAVHLLESPEWADIAAGLAVLTGRRSSELLSTAQFEKATQWSVTFTGALKRRQEKQILSFEIPTLATADRVIAALGRVRHELPNAVGMPAEEVNRKYGDKVAQSCDRHFGGLVPSRGEDNLYTHLFRAVYATIASFWYCPSWVNETEYKAAIQGHYAVLDETDPQLRRSLAASRHYADYEIADKVIAQAGGKRKGIKLGYAGIKPIEMFNRHDNPLEAETAMTQTKTTTATTPRARKRGGSKSSVWIWIEDKPRIQQVLAHFGDGKDALTQDAMAAWIDWTIDRLLTEVEGEVVAEMESIPQGLRRNIATAAVDQPEPELQSDVEVELDLHDQPATEPDAASSLDEKFEKVMGMFEQFMQFQMQQPTPASGGQQQPTQSPNDFVARSAIANGAVSQSHSAMENRSDDRPAPGQPRQSKPRDSESKAASRAQFNQAIDAILQHNNTPDLLHDLKWEVSANTLKSLTGNPNQRIAQQVMLDRAQEIQQHHARHQIQPGHNHRHKRKRIIGEVIKLNPPQH